MHCIPFGCLRPGPATDPYICPFLANEMQVHLEHPHGLHFGVPQKKEIVIKKINEQFNPTKYCYSESGATGIIITIILHREKILRNSTKVLDIRINPINCYLDSCAMANGAGITSIILE